MIGFDSIRVLGGPGATLHAALVAGLGLLVGCAGATPAPRAQETDAERAAMERSEASLPQPTHEGSSDAVDESSAPVVLETPVQPAPEPCAELPGARLVRLDDMDSPRDGSGEAHELYMKRVTPVSEGVEGGEGGEFSPGFELRQARGRVVQILFLSTRAEDPVGTLDCESPGICRRALYLRCQDGSYAEIVPPGRHGSFRRSTHAPEALTEARAEGQVQFEVQWQWHEGHFESEGQPSRITLPTPALSESERSVGVPATSHDGRKIALVHSWGTDLEGMGQNYMDFRVHRTRDGRVLQTIRLYGEDEMGEPSLSEAATQRAYARANTILTRGRYRALTPLLPFDRHEHPLRDASGAGVRLVADGQGALHISGAIQVEHSPRGVSTSAYCCGLEDGDIDNPRDDACQLLPTVQAAWADAVTRVVLVTLEASSPTSGCEYQGDRWMWMHRGRSRN